MPETPQSDSGIPVVERMALGAALKLGSAFLGPNRQLKLFATEANRILELVDQFDFDFASQRARIPRMVGIENSSCHWSLFMVLDHLIRVDQEIMGVIQSLRRGFEPHRQIAIARFKPDGAAGAETIEAFQETAREFRKVVLELIPLRTSARFPHPWFGPLDAHGWLTLAAAHHRIHRRQARKIAAVLGIA